MTATVRNNHFSGNANVYSAGDDGLSNVLRSALQYITADRASSLTTPADSSGGTPNGDTLPEIQDYTSFTGSGGVAPMQPDYDGFLSSVQNAIASLALQVNNIESDIDVGGLTDNSGGSGSPTNVPSITTSFSSSSSSVAFDTAQSRLDDMRGALVDLTPAVNRLATAVGVTLLSVPASYPTFDYDSTVRALSATSGSAVFASTSPTVSTTDAQNRASEVADAVATMAAKIQQITDGSGKVVNAVAQ